MRKELAERKLPINWFKLSRIVVNPQEQERGSTPGPTWGLKRNCQVLVVEFQCQDRIRCAVGEHWPEGEPEIRVSSLQGQFQVKTGQTQYQCLPPRNGIRSLGSQWPGIFRVIMSLSSLSLTRRNTSERRLPVASTQRMTYQRFSKHPPNSFTNRTIPFESTSDRRILHPYACLCAGVLRVQ